MSEQKKPIPTRQKIDPKTGIFGISAYKWAQDEQQKNASNVQSIVFDKNRWRLIDAQTWVKSFGYDDKVDETPTSYRFRQFDPEEGKKYYTYKVKGQGMSFIHD